MGGETSREIDHEAALWAARIDRAPLSPEDEATLELWLQADPRHLGSFAKARAVALHSLRAAGLATEDAESSLTPMAPPIERRALLVATVAAGLVTATGLGAAYWRKAQTFETQKGEVRTIALGEGSLMVLSTATRASVRFSRMTREIVLTFGEALFLVAKGQRPFVVHTVGTSITTQAGRFVVRRLDRRPLQVLALDTQVNLRSSLGRSWQVHPRRRLDLYGENVREKSVDAAAIERAVAWQAMNLAFENDTLRMAVAEFARFSSQQIELADQSVADLRISGLFKATEPEAFARAVAVSLNLHVHIDSAQIQLGPKII